MLHNSSKFNASNTRLHRIVAIVVQVLIRNHQNQAMKIALQPAKSNTYLATLSIKTSKRFQIKTILLISKEVLVHLKKIQLLFLINNILKKTLQRAHETAPQAVRELTVTEVTQKNIYTILLKDLLISQQLNNVLRCQGKR